MIFLQDFISLFYPQICLGCKQPLVKNEKLLCLSCLLNLPQTNFHKLRDNKIEKIFTGRFPFQKATAFLYFAKGGIVQSILHHLKYKNFPEIGVMMGEITGRQLKKDNFFNDIDFLVPVPLHPNKKKKRGYNQSEVICQGIKKATGTKLSTDNLVRSTFSETQTRKSRFDRWLNVEKIFAVQNPENFTNKHILLIDDVVTTGSTVEACATKLSTIENIKVSLLTLAHA